MHIWHCSTNMKYVHCPGNKNIICIPHWAGQKSLPVTHFSCCFKFAHNVHLLSYIDSIILTLTVGAVVIVIVLLVGFTTTCAISAYHHKSCEFEPPRIWRDVLDTTLYDNVWQWLETGRWFSLRTLVSSTIKTDCHDITEILLKVTLNTLTLTLKL